MRIPFVDLPRRLLMTVVRGYRLLLSPWLGSSCRFEPTCSLYTLEALERHGAAAGTYLGACRIARCHPWCRGGLDPVPQHLPRMFTWHHSFANGTRRPPPSSHSDHP